MNTDLKPIIAAAIDGPLDQETAIKAFDILFDGSASATQIAALLIAMRTRGEALQEYQAAAKVMRDKCLPVHAPANAMDIVGTGGDGKGTLNISTATSFVVAGAGVCVAKHGNRNLSSKSGAADALGTLGIETMISHAHVEAIIAEVGIGFMMAPMHHPAMKYVGPVRAELGVRTIFNILGPLTNPASVTRQLTGAFSADLLEPMAETLRFLGTHKAWLVHGGDGTDELSISAPSEVVQLDHTQEGLIRTQIAPEDFGLPQHPFDEILGGTPEHNAAAMTALFAGEKNAYRDAVLLNSAAALRIADAAPSNQDAMDMARESIDSGSAAAKLAALVSATQKAAAS